MLVKIILRTPGGHNQIGGTKMSQVPRQGDLVIINDVTRTVHSVAWDLTEMSVTIFLND